jgi:outer membrane protein OmpA-like peptidoglycan-associated protein
VIAGVVAVVVGVLGVVAWAAQQTAVDAKAEADALRDAAQAAEKTAKTAEAEAVTQRNEAVIAKGVAEVEKDGAELARKMAEAAELAAVTARRENERLLQDLFRAALRSLIVNLARDGSLSGEVVVDKRWSPLLERETALDRKKQRFAAFTVIKNGGRIVVAGHDAVLSATDRQGYSVFLEMTSKWLLRNREQRRIIVLSDSGNKSPTVQKLEKNLTTLNYEHTTKSSFDDLSDADMLIIANRHQDLTDDETRSIKDFIARGGGVLAVGVGWSWMASKAAKGQAPPTLDNYPMNQLLREFGAEWNDKKIEGLEKPPEPRVTLFEGAGFEGASQSFGVGAHDVNAFRRIRDNQVSSVKVDAGLRVTLYEEVGFKGSTMLLKSDANDLDYFEDLCSGIKVERIRPNDEKELNVVQPPQESHSASDQVEVYDNANFTGRSQTYGVGMHANLGMGDDRITSIKVPKGMTVTLFENSDFTGSRVTLTSNRQSLPSFNDMCSGIIVEKYPPQQILVFSSLTSEQAMPQGPVTLVGVYFDLDQDTIKTRSYPVIDRLVVALSEFTTWQVEISGHVDTIGDREYNLGLSLRRAESLKKYLVEHGISADRIETRGAGSAEPVDSNFSARGRAKNRRIELKFRLK